MLKYFGFGKTPARQGYVYVGRDEEAGPLTRAAIGDVARIKGRGPPWIAVTHDLSSMVPAGWPGRLWRVEIVDAIRKHEMKAHGGLRDDAPYTRAAAVKVLEEVPVASLFGRHGASVCVVIAAAGGLTVERTTALASARHADAGAAQTRVWRAWLARKGVPSDRYSDDLDGTLAIGPDRSPVGGALSLVHLEVTRRASAIGGKAAWATEDESAWLVEPWSGASSALVDAALAFGASEIVSPADRDVLATAWRTVIGADP